MFLLREIRHRQECLISLADKAPLTEIVPAEAFFAQLQASWHEIACIPSDRCAAQEDAFSAGCEGSL